MGSEDKFESLLSEFLFNLSLLLQNIVTIVKFPLEWTVFILPFILNYHCHVTMLMLYTNFFRVVSLSLLLMFSSLIEEIILDKLLSLLFHPSILRTALI
jgi:hypothetical protein